MKPRRIGILGYEAVAELAFVGPLQAFSSACHGDIADAPSPCYDVATIGLRGPQFTTESGLIFQAQHTIEAVPELDTLIVPGGRGLRGAETSRAVADWVSSRAATTRRIVSICTGIYGIAPTGLLDHRRVTTHWRFVRDVARRFPSLDLQQNALFLQDGKFFSSAGGTAGIDLAIALISQDCGSDVALSVARDLLVYLQRDGGQEQYAEPLMADRDPAGEFGGLACWIDAHLAGDLRLEKLAQRVGLGKVHFIRQFKSTFGVTPALFIKNRRLNEARRRLLAGENTAKVARGVGFRSALYFSQEFKWRFGTGPDEYQSRFRIAPQQQIRATRAVDPAAPVPTAARGRRWELRRPPHGTSAARSRKKPELLLDAA